MASQSDNSVSQELGELLELLNALETQDSRPLENFATLERLLAAGKVSPAGLPSNNHHFDDPQFDGHQSEIELEAEIDGGFSEAALQSSSDEPIAESPDWRDDEWPQEQQAEAGIENRRPEAEVENRLAVHIIQGLRKSIKDWKS